ncbi:aldo/keto reductase, partial [candidate division KSB1 bacterium]|nr:aldo/keto reductase [candidate division KSB1 bacterium]
MSTNANPLNRRKFLQTGALAAVGIGLGANPQSRKEQKSEKPDPKKILNYQPDMRYRRLGSTDIYFSVISLGGIGIKKEVALYAIDHGVNLVHMSSDYNSGSSIKVLGSILKERRDKVYIALKDSFYDGSLEDIDKPLKTMNTDYVDFLMFNRHSAAKVNDPKIVENFEKWKAQGKVRFAGLTTHDDVKDCVSTAIKTGIFRVIQPVLNQPGLELLQEELKQALEKGIGVMAMKTMKGVDDNAMQMALLKKILNNPAVTTVNKGIKSFDMFDMFLKTAKETLTSQEDFDLYRYAQQNRSNNCMMCGKCKRACPQQIEIP